MKATFEQSSHFIKQIELSLKFLFMLPKFFEQPSLQHCSKCNKPTRHLALSAANTSKTNIVAEEKALQDLGNAGGSERAREEEGGQETMARVREMYTISVAGTEIYILYMRRAQFPFNYE